MTSNGRFRSARSGRKFSPGRAAWAVAALVAATVGVVVAVRGHRSDMPASAGPVGAAVSASADVCVDFASRAQCEQVTASGRAWRYTLHRPTKPTRETVVADFGGPGVPVLANDYLSAFATHVPAVFDRYNVVAVDEPWSTTQVAPECRKTLSDFWREIHSAPTGRTVQVARAVRPNCHLQEGRWGFTPASYRQVVEAIGAKEDLSYVGFIGQSFASMRLSYLQDSPVGKSLDWAVLSRPFPVGAAGRSLISQRAAAISTVLKKRSATAPKAPPARMNNGVVSPFDSFSAGVEVGYLAADEQARAAADISAGDQDVITRLSDQLWQRYGDNDISPAYLAQLDELCGAVRAEPPSSYRGPADVLAVQLLPCVSARNVSPAAKLSIGRVPLCVASAGADSVTPQALVRAALKQASTKTTWVELVDPSHQGENGIPQCLSRLGVDPGD